MKTQSGLFYSWMLAALLAQMASSSTWAAPVTFDKPVAIANDSDVITVGTLVYAFNLGGTDQTVNNVLFSAANTGHARPQVTVGNLSIAAGGDAGSVIAVVDTPTFVGEGEPFTSLSAAYRSLLGSADYSNSTKGTLTVRLGGLKAGTHYTVQFFVNDSRGTDRADTVTSGGVSSDPVVFNTATAPGGVGETLTASFTADGDAQEFIFAPVVGASNGDAQLNAVQVRMTPPASK